MRQRNIPLKGLINKSPLKNNKTSSIAPSGDKKTSYTGSDSEYKSKDTFASRNIHRFIPKNTPAGIMGAVAGGGLIRNLGKVAKAVKSGVSALIS
tara:strand:+ start:93 stop:377 length:285 start_codon:yes stop_codon:yes gene_type:complete